ncbi:hypothetical protein EV189_3124 [Motilibacter rhizosphaerae]|uniref:Ferritin-like metal-binding protein YciE n=1 Tax=Motilibacter rhizosphaerae TaxID=598652 RepID=A0A4Q7NG06_9ACTN|nr:hypothetical protein [Motilibacter rhizosphaerae]RZS82729.1 hypothetical protein EV189_3124 [Motilibacter rhizosphaerae]
MSGRQLPVLVAELLAGEEQLAAALREVGQRHAAEADVVHTAHVLAEHGDARAAQLRALGPAALVPHAPGIARAALAGNGPDGTGLVLDLLELYALAAWVDQGWTLLGQVAQGERDEQLLAAVGEAEQGASKVLAWVGTRAEQAAPQAMLVPPD